MTHTKRQAMPKIADEDDFGGAGALPPPREMADIAAGEECWAIIARRLGKGDRREIIGPCRVVVVDAHVAGVFGAFRVRIVRGAAGLIVGHEHDARRHDLYPVRVRAEHLAFGAEVSRLWSSPVNRAGRYVLMLCNRLRRERLLSPTLSHVKGAWLAGYDAGVLDERQRARDEAESAE